MKKYLLLLFLCILPALAFGDAAVIGEVEQMISGETDPCSPRGTADLYWDGEYTADRDNACISGGVANGTLSGAVINTDQNHTSGGGYALDVDANGEYLLWSGELLNLDEGSIVLWFWCDGDVSDTTHLINVDDASGNLLVLYIRGTDDLWVVHRCSWAGAGADTVASINSGWNKVQVEWDNGINDHVRVKMNDGSWEELLTGLGDTCTDYDFSIGDRAGGGVAEQIYIDDVWMWRTYGQSS